MRPSYRRLLTGVVRQVASSIAEVQSARFGGLTADATTTLGSNPLTWFLGRHVMHASAAPWHAASTSTLHAARQLHTSPFPHCQAAPSETGNPSSPYTSTSAVAPSSTPNTAEGGSPSRHSLDNVFQPRQLPSRGKTPRQGRTPALPIKPLQPAPSKPAKAPRASGAKAASAAAAAKAGGQRPLPREARAALDARVALTLLPHSRGMPAAGPETATVTVTGFYLGHPITRTTADALVQQLRNQPLAPGVTLAGVYPDNEHTLLLLTSPSDAEAATAAAAVTATATGPAGPAKEGTAGGAAAAGAAAVAEPKDGSGPRKEGGVAAAAAGLTAATGTSAAALADGAPAPPATTAVRPESEARRETAESQAQDTGPPSSPSSSASSSWSSSPGAPYMAIMLLEYGGVAFFNVPEPLLLDALARVAATALPQAKQAHLPLPPRRGSGVRADGEAWRRAAAEKLHREEQLLVVSPHMGGGPGRNPWIRKLDDALLIWTWDSINLETAACVVTQSAAIRFYNQECEEMCQRYETIMPLVGDQPSEGGSSRGGRYWRQRLPLEDLQKMVFECSGIRVRLYSRLSLREPPACTWESARHHAVWDAMRREFELDDRRDTLMEKTDLLKQSCLDLISANNESFTKMSEIAIIGLISVEIMISLTGMEPVLTMGNARRAAEWLTAWVPSG